MTSATSATSERGKGMFSKITFLKSVHSSEKDELCPGFEVKILTKSVHRGGVWQLGIFPEITSVIMGELALAAAQWGFYRFVSLKRVGTN